MSAIRKVTYRVYESEEAARLRQQLQALELHDEIEALKMELEYKRDKLAELEPISARFASAQKAREAGYETGRYERPSEHRLDYTINEEEVK